jgi:hypothetical protein
MVMRYIFFPFWYVVKEKSGNPDWNSKAPKISEHSPSGLSNQASGDPDERVQDRRAVRGQTEQPNFGMLDLGIRFLPRRS